MKTINVTCEWRTSHTIEVSDDFDAYGEPNLDRLPDDVLDQMTSQNGELTNWTVEHG